MRRALALLLVVAGLIGAACTAFDFPAPAQASADAAPEASLDGGAEASGPVGLLDVEDAARLCAQIFACPRLAQAIDLSMALPLDAPASPLNFSGCMDWVAAPIDPARVGLAEQRALLGAVAQAGSCAAAGAALPVQPVDGGPTCATTSCTSPPGALQTCGPDAGTFLVPCDQTLDLYAQSGACVTDVTGSQCVTSGKCTVGTLCSDNTTLQDCRAGGQTYTAFDCALSGRQCAPLSDGLADCVFPGNSSAPCPLHDARDECDVNAVLHCAGGITAQTEFNCQAVGRTCSTSNSAGVARCVDDDGGGCSPFDGNENACNGTQIAVCIGGAATTFDCASIGLQCVGPSSSQTAHCGAGG